MVPIPVFLLVLPILGIALAASLALARDRVRPGISLFVILVSAIAPIFFFSRTAPGQSSGRSLWEWTAAGGPVMQAAYQVDDLALIGSAIVTLVTGAALHAVAAGSASRSLLTALVAIDGIALVALVSVTDVVAGILVAGTAAMIAVAVAIFVASEPGAARLAALLALGVESFIAAALLLGRFGVATFDLDGVPREAITPGVLAATVLGATLLCGLYPFVPWRYEPRAVPPPLASLRGVALFPIGVAGSVLALRLLAASGAPITSLPLPDVPLAWQALLLLLILTLTALAVLFGPREARMRRALTGASFIVLVAALSFLHLSHVIAILALLTVLYATVASAAVVEEWQVARFDVRLGVLWAAIASGAPLALAGALFGLLASAVALVLEVMPIPSGARVGVSTSARVLVVIGPFLTLAGLATTPDPIVGSLCAVTLVIAGLLELAHAARGVSADAVKPRGRLYATAAALAMTSVFGLIVSLPVTRAAMALFAPTPADWSDLVMVALAALVIAVTVAVVTLPQVVGRIRVSARVLAFLRRLLTATDPAPALALAYRGLEVWSRRTGAASASFEDRAGVWVAMLLIALTLLWAATS